MIRLFTRLYSRLLNLVRINLLWPLTKSLKYSRLNSYFSCAHFEVGSFVFIGPCSYFSTRKRLVIGSHSLIGPRVMILSGNHDFHPVGKRIRDQSVGIDKDVIIGEDVWIGAGSIIIGCNISDGVVIGAGSIVVRDLPPYTVCVGVPCKPIKKRFSDSDLYQHLMHIGLSHSEATIIVQSRNECLNRDQQVNE